MPCTNHPLITNVSYTLNPKISLIANINFKSKCSGTVQIKYWNTYAGTFLSRKTQVCFNQIVTIPIVRLRANTTYQYQIILHTCSCKPYVSETYQLVSGALPTLFTSNVSTTITGMFSGTGVTILIIVGTEPGFFEGYVAIDQDGQVVWYYQQPDRTAVANFAKMMNGNFLINPGDPLGIPTSVSPYTSFPQIITPLGNIESSAASQCSLNLNNIGVKFATIGTWGNTHCAIQDPGEPKRVLMFGLNLKDPFYDAGLTGPGERLQMGNTIRQWIPETNTQTTLLSLFDILDPITYRSTLSDSTDVNNASCTLATGPNNQDWLHANDIARLSGDSNYFVSLRNTSSILIMDSNLRTLYKFGIAQPSDFTFLSSNDHFYNQHDPHELCNGNVLMFDDGTTRPLSEGGPYARAIEYKLDYQNRTISKVWEFRPPTDLFCQSQGSARRLPNGNTVIDFGAPTLSTKYIYEVRLDTSVVGLLELTAIQPDTIWYIFHAIPIDSIYGETRIC